MNVKQFVTDDDAVSPVIGVILMVAITVILAAVIATFVLGLGDQVSNTAPQASFSFQWDGPSGGSSDLVVIHDGGETLKASNIYLRGSVGTGGQATLGKTWDKYSSANPKSQISAGERATIGKNDGASDKGIGSDGKVSVVWQSTTGENSATLADWAGPDA